MLADNPEIIEGDVPTIAKTKPHGKKSKQFTNRYGAHSLRRIAVVGRYAGILLHIRDEKTLESAATKGRGLQKVSVSWAGSLKVGSGTLALTLRHTASRRCGEVHRTILCRMVQSRRVDIHPDRGNCCHGGITQKMQSDSLNQHIATVSTEKVEGGSGESFLKERCTPAYVNFEGSRLHKYWRRWLWRGIDELQDKFSEVAGN